MSEYAKNGDTLINLPSSLWDILKSATWDPESGQVICVLDALDECAETELKTLLYGLKQHFSSETDKRGKLRFLLTSRPYDNIISSFQVLVNTCPYIRIPGEDESEIISEEVNTVIKHRVNLLAKEKDLKPHIREYLEKKLLEVEHRTYLWVYLVLNHLSSYHFKRTIKGVESQLNTLPLTVEGVYEKILSKSKGREMVQKTLCIILAAQRPLTVQEINIAVNVAATSKSSQDLDLEDEEDFKAALRDWCGLFVSVHSEKIYFLHQTAREFLIREVPPLSKVLTDPPVWKHSITIREAHTVLAESCIGYLSFYEFHDVVPRRANGSPDLNSIHWIRGFLEENYLFGYAASYWDFHVRQAEGIDKTLNHRHLALCNPSASVCWSWYQVSQYVRLSAWRIDSNEVSEFTNLTLGAYLGHIQPIQAALGRGANVNEFAEMEGGKTALWYACKRGHADIAKFLLEHGADPNVHDENRIYPLHLIIRSEDLVLRGLISLFFDKGSLHDVSDQDGITPLHDAARSGDGNTAALLISKGAKIDALDIYGETPLHYASSSQIVSILLDRGADIEARDKYLQTPIHTAKSGEAISMLLNRGANIEARERIGLTPLEFGQK